MQPYVKDSNLKFFIKLNNFISDYLCTQCSKGEFIKLNKFSKFGYWMQTRIWRGYPLVLANACW